MTLPELKSCFRYTRSQRGGLLFLFALIAALQLTYYFADFSAMEKMPQKERQWLALQTEIDSLKEARQYVSPKIYPFNPNFITDFKGYKLGMSAVEIDRLLAFRETGKYVNSAREFQLVTRVSDALLGSISPYFKFPDWVKNKKKYNKEYQKYASQKKEKVVIKDINQATKEDLVKLYGIGHGLSERILKEKEKFGAFVSMEQMSDIWGLSPEVVEKLNESFHVSVPPEINKIDINNASVKELMKFPYFRYALAREIVTFRSMHGEIHGVEDLIKINGFPVEKVNVIALYLEF